MLGDGANALRDGEPPSERIKEVVPTSDDEDLFFLSQSSDRYGSSSCSAPRVLHSDDEVGDRDLRSTNLDNAGDVTLYAVARSPSPVQRSDLTLPLASEPVTSPPCTSSSTQNSVVKARPTSDITSTLSLMNGSAQNPDDDQQQPFSTPPAEADEAEELRWSRPPRQESEVPRPVAPEASPMSSPPLPSLRIPARAPAPPTSPIYPLPISHAQAAADPTVNDEHMARAAAAQPPTPPRRQLRARKAAQLNPYTLEAMRYQRALIRNDWEDALVSQREWHRQERRRLAEEAARAERERQAVQGSEESQSQWLVPSSGPSSQANQDDPSTPSSSPVPIVPEVFVDIPILGNALSPPRPGSSNVQSRGPSLSSSRSERHSELTEMLTSSLRHASPRKNRDRVGTSGHSTYKGHRTVAQAGSEGPLPQPLSAQDSQLNEEEVAPLPVPVRRQNPLRALSPSDNEDDRQGQAEASRNHEPFIVESSEDERLTSVAPIQRTKRRSRWSGDGSSSDSTDYERRFRQLKKMMPAGMARKHIRDLRAMRHGKAYHSDGHVSSTSSSGGGGTRAVKEVGAPLQSHSNDPHEVSGGEELQPGQTRKRLRRHDSTDANNALLLEPDSDSSSSSASTLSSDTSVHSTHAYAARPPKETILEEAEDTDERPAAWWSVNRLDSYVPYRERDAIDRMLSRTGGRKRSSKLAIPKAQRSFHQRQARLDGVVSTHRHQLHRKQASGLHLREIDQNQRNQPRPTVDASGKDAHPRLIKRRERKKRKLDPRVGRTSNSSNRAVPGPLQNPPVVRPRAKPRLDLEHHALLFAADPAKHLSQRVSEAVEHALDEGPISDDGGQWEDLGNIVLDVTPAPLPDARLAMPRSRLAGPPQQAMLRPAFDNAVSSPARNAHTSSSVSQVSGDLSTLNAVDDRSPGTPTRTRSIMVPHKDQSHPHAAQFSTISSTAGINANGSDAWDEFEGVSLDFGMCPLIEGSSLTVQDSPLMARLPDLVALPDRLLHRQHIPWTWSGDVLRLDDTLLSTDMDHDALTSKLPFYMDNLRLKVSRVLADDIDEDTRRHARKLVADTGVFLGCWLVRQAEGAVDGSMDASTPFRSYRIILERIEQLQVAMLSLPDSSQSTRSAREERKLICLHLAWMRFELCWRAMAICDSEASYALEPDAPTVENLLIYSRALISLLLHHGLHRSIRNLRKATAAVHPTETSSNGATTLDPQAESSASLDETTSMWLGIIHLLDSFEKNRGIIDGRLFWTQFETAYQRWDGSMPKRASLLRAESLWYCLFAISTLSQISTAGQMRAAPLLRECWPLVTRALNLVKLRSDESIEMAMGWHMLAKRDAYVRVVLQRCCLLASEWRWNMEGAEASLAQLFDIFNSNKLADLPTETEHDFPAFLRDFDIGKLSVDSVADGEAAQEPSFHLFVRLLARAGQELRDSVPDAKEGDRRISRLFSRMTPVRVMPFTRREVPTSSQRSVLFNHYTVVMLFLQLVPTSSPQRLRQIQSFLPAFKEADFLSQVTCIRAMMYVAVIFRHHLLDLSPVTKWFGDTITTLRREYEEIDASTKQYERQQMQRSLQHRGGRPDSIRMANIFENAPARQAALRRKEEVARLLVVALRSIQHVIRHDGLGSGRAQGMGHEKRLPDQLLLSAAWTQQMLEAQVSLEPRIGQEVLKCIQTFLLARFKALQLTTNRSSTAVANGISGELSAHQQQARDEESQDSFAELFEADLDFDFEDPLLAQLLDGGGVHHATAERDASREEASKAAAAAETADKRMWDREFGELVKSTISPSLFQLMSNIYHPDRRIEAATTGSVAMSLGVTERLTEPCFSKHPWHGYDAGRVPAYRTRMDQLLKAAEARQYLELVVDCWAGCAQVLVTNGLRQWSSYLGFGNESWKRIDDPIGRRDVGLRFLQNVVSLDPGAAFRKEYEVEFITMWVQTAVARVLSVQDVYTTSLVDAVRGKDDNNKAPLLSSLTTQWRSILAPSTSDDATAAPADEVAQLDLNLKLDLDTFPNFRLALLSTTFAWLASTLGAGVASTGTAYSILSALLSSLRAYVEDTPARAASLGYLRFCRATLVELEQTLGGMSVMQSLRAEFVGATQLVQSKIDTSGTGEIGDNHL